MHGCVCVFVRVAEQEARIVAWASSEEILRDSMQLLMKRSALQLDECV